MLEAFSSARNRFIMFVLLAACGALTIAAVAVGVSDNPPGILLAFLAAGAFVLAFVYPWRTARQFKFLCYASLLSIGCFALLAAFFDLVVSKWLAHLGVPRGLLESLALVVFSVAISLFPLASLIGAAGWVALSIRDGRRRTKSRDGAA